MAIGQFLRPIRLYPSGCCVFGSEWLPKIDLGPILSIDSSHSWTLVVLILHLGYLLCTFDSSLTHLLHKTTICWLSHVQARVQLVWCGGILAIPQISALGGLLSEPSGSLLPVCVCFWASLWPLVSSLLCCMLPFIGRFLRRRCLPLPLLARAFSLFSYSNTSTGFVPGSGPAKQDLHKLRGFAQ
jgi:hypothetical protein